MEVMCVLCSWTKKKAFDTIKHNLMIPKLGAYGFSQDTLHYTKSYLTNRQQSSSKLQF